ncbi:MAG: hypothetical protein IT458_11650 [Planctomycetes bacterium]|nr:hypothetical protein [Planctomycetota bacterium]
MWSLLLLQGVLAFTVEGEGPVRFGFPLRPDDVARGLCVAGVPGARVACRVLQAEPDPRTGRIWVELAIEGVRGAARLVRAGREPASAPVEVRRTTESVPEGLLVTTRWRWRGGAEDVRRRWTFHEATVWQGEAVEPGECATRHGEGLPGRFLRVRVPAGEWQRAGVLPPDQGLAGELRQRLAAAARTLPELPGWRGAGDYLRAGGVVTNLEFDTALAFARLALREEDPELLAKAWRSAWHLVDRDLDRRTGLPFVHGSDHRRVRPEPGHVWLQGVFLVGLLSADDELVEQARALAQALARHPRLRPERARDERARDLGWPLLELESWLRFQADEGVQRTADQLAQQVLARFDPTQRVLRFGEGERERGLYEDRVWISGGILLPALRAHVARSRAPAAARVVQVLEEALEERIRRGGAGLPVRVLLHGGDVVDAFRAEGLPELVLALEGLAPAALARLVPRAGPRRALAGIPADGDPQLATSLTMAGRCTWILR